MSAVSPLVTMPVLELTLSHCSQALPAPNPRPTHAGQALLLNNKTEKTTPKDRPREERMTMEERQRSHCKLVSAMDFDGSSMLRPRAQVCGKDSNILQPLTDSELSHTFSLRRPSLKVLPGRTTVTGVSGTGASDIVTDVCAEGMWVEGLHYCSCLDCCRDR